MRHRTIVNPGRNRHRQLAKAATTLVAAAGLTGCATLDSGHDAARIDALLAARGAPATGWDHNGDDDAGVVSTWLSQPLTSDVAVRVAMIRSPRLQQLYGDLGLAHADILSAVQVANPRFGVSSLALQNGPGSQLMLGLAAPLVDLITPPQRTRLARLEQERARLCIAGAVLTVSLDVESAWYRYVGAEQVAGMRGAVAEALQTVLSVGCEPVSPRCGSVFEVDGYPASDCHSARAADRRSLKVSRSTIWRSSLK
jgi:cobalt-zinc-cadmium efflux system outer membrane protein